MQEQIKIWRNAFSNYISVENFNIEALSFEQQKAIYAVFFILNSLMYGVDFDDKDLNNFIKYINLVDQMLCLILDRTPQGKGEKFVKVVNIACYHIALHQMVGPKEKLNKIDGNFLTEIPLSNFTIYLSRLFYKTTNYLIQKNQSNIKANNENFLKKLNKLENILITKEIKKRRNPRIDAFITVLKNLIFGILTAGVGFAINKIVNDRFFFYASINSESRLQHKGEIKKIFNICN